MIEKLPEAARKVRQHVSAAREGGPTALQNIQEAATEIQGAAADATGAREACEVARRLRARQGSRAQRVAARLRARAVRPAVRGGRAGADRAAARILPSRLGRALPPQAGAIGRAVAFAQEGRRAHPRGDRRADPALPARHAGVERPGRHRHLACVRGAGNGAGGRMGRHRGRASLHSLPRPGAVRDRERRGRVHAIRDGARRARRRGRIAAGGGWRRVRDHDRGCRAVSRA